MDSPPILPQSAKNIYNVNDFIEFRRYDVIESPEINDYITYRGVIDKIINKNLLGVKVVGEKNIFWINPISITKHYPFSNISNISIRTVFKSLWKNIVFRQVKTVKTRGPLKIVQKYVNSMGFPRYRRLSLYNPNVKKTFVEYEDYFGFTTDETFRKNDSYINQEIFFSKKCYCELNLSEKVITGDFSTRRGYNAVPPVANQYICGLVENGEKGLFYRKWFMCSEEFKTLWTMFCEPDHVSLKTYDKNKIRTKTLEEIISSLNTKRYRDPKKLYNVEEAALYIPHVYQIIANSLTNPKIDPTVQLYENYQDRLHKEILWMKYKKL